MYVRQKKADENIITQSNLNEAVLNILNDEECIKYGQYKDVVTDKLLKVTAEVAGLDLHLIMRGKEISQSARFKKFWMQ